MNTTTNTGAASMNFKEFRAALCRFNDANTPVSIADRVMILSNAMFLLDQYERVTPTPQADAAPTKDAVMREQIEQWASEAGINHFTEKHLECLGDFAILARMNRVAAIAAGGAQEPILWVSPKIIQALYEQHKPGQAGPVWPHETEFATIPLVVAFAAPLPREAATIRRDAIEQCALVVDALKAYTGLPLTADFVAARIRSLIAAPAASSNGEQ